MDLITAIKLSLHILLTFRNKIGIGADIFVYITVPFNIFHT